MCLALGSARKLLLLPTGPQEPSPGGFSIPASTTDHTAVSPALDRRRSGSREGPGGPKTGAGRARVPQRCRPQGLLGGAVPGSGLQHPLSFGLSHPLWARVGGQDSGQACAKCQASEPCLVGVGVGGGRATCKAVSWGFSSLVSSSCWGLTPHHHWTYSPGRFHRKQAWGDPCAKPVAGAGACQEPCSWSPGPPLSRQLPTRLPGLHGVLLEMNRDPPCTSCPGITSKTPCGWWGWRKFKS